MNLPSFITFDSSGLHISSYQQIWSSLLNYYRSVYGSDIDVSTGTADGAFVAEVAEMISKICETVQSAWFNLDASTAKGVYLDSLCRLSNIRRMPATKSVASIEITNNSAEGTDDVVLTPSNEFYDQAGVAWNLIESVSVSAGETVSATVACSQSGRILAPAGWINSIDQNNNCSVNQPGPATVGLDRESDASLRARRSSTSGRRGSTTIGSLQGSLIDLAGIRDVAIYNNTVANTETDGNPTGPTSADGTVLLQHSIYVIVRRDPAIKVEDSVIGNLIYNKLTPGIPTIVMKADVTTGTQKSYSIDEIDHLQVETQTVYWKEASSVAPSITITVTPDTQVFSREQLALCGWDLIDWINNLPITTNLSTTEIFVKMIDLIPTVKGYRICSVTPSDIAITGASNGVYTNQDTFYSYNNVNIGASSGSYVMTLSYEAED